MAKKTTAKTVKKTTTKKTTAPKKVAAKVEETKAVELETKAEVAPKAEVKAETKVETAPKAEAKAETKVEAPKAEAKTETKVEATPKAEVKAETKVEATPKAEVKAETKVEAPKKAEVKEEPKAKVAPKVEAKVEEKAAPAPKVEAKVEEKVEAVKEVAEKAEEKKPAKKAAAKKATTKKAEPKKAAAKKTTKKAATKKAAEEKAPEKPVEPVKEEVAAPVVEEAVQEAPAPEVYVPQPRRSIAFIGSECYPFVKTGGLGDVMYALPKALVKQNCDVKVIIPRYACIPQEWQEKMVYKGAFDMDLCSDGKSYYVGIMEYVEDGVVYDFIDNQEFFTSGNPYTNLVDDIPKFCYFSKAALAALNYLDWYPDIIHCHDWQAGLVPIFLREMFGGTNLAHAKTIMTIHNLRFQGVYNIETLKYWTNLPDYVFNKDTMTEKWLDANMLKGGLTYANAITTVSNTYAGEIQTEYYGEGLDAHLRYHSGKLRGIVNGIDVDIWNPATDNRLAVNYDISNVLDKKKENKLALQRELGLQEDESKFVIGLVSRLTDQKGLDLVNAIVPQIMDEFTQVVVLGTGDPVYENSFRYYENEYKGRFCANIMYDETRSHHIYAGADALLVPSQFEPCGLTQLIAMHYGDIPIVRETGGLKDTVQPYNQFTNDGNGFTFDNYDAGLLLDAINRAKSFYFTQRWQFDEMVQRNMAKDVSWEKSAAIYRELYVDLTR